jgi:outer membrane lipoprotein SlyB
MDKKTCYLIGIVALFSLNACAPQDSATAEDMRSESHQESAQQVPAESAPPARSSQPQAVVAPAPAPVPVICQTCGTVRSVTAVTQQGQTTGTGAVLGAIVGGVAGNQVGGGSGRTIATAAGAIGGALLGNNIEQNRNAAAYYEVVIDMENGSQQVINLQNPSGLGAGMRVTVVNGNITIR